MSLRCLLKRLLVSKYINKPNRLHTSANLTSSTNSSINMQKDKLEDKPQMVLTDDGSMFIAWHPKQDFPYECTLPLPDQEKEDTTSVLKTQMTSELKEIFRKKTPEQARQELMNITHTTKHRWFPRARDKKAKKTPMDREYL